jgi:NAD(P)-dependent dehydrogenase (short-subunit alcohol dehydrogenase family)
MQAVVPELRKRGGGTIINMTSGAGDLVEAGAGGELDVLGGERLAYAASKAALNRLGNALSAELAADGIALVSVDPGFTRTELVDLMGDKGIVDADRAIPMSTPMRAVVELITTDEGMRLRGQIVRASEYVATLGASSS